MKQHQWTQQEAEALIARIPSGIVIEMAAGVLPLSTSQLIQLLTDGDASIDAVKRMSVYRPLSGHHSLKAQEDQEWNMGLVGVLVTLAAGELDSRTPVPQRMVAAERLADIVLGGRRDGAK